MEQRSTAKNESNKVMSKNDKDIKKKRKKYECQKSLVETGEKCLGSLILSYDSGAPIFTCDRCGFVDGTWKKFYNEYLHLYKTREHWEEEKHKISCIIGLFCHKYKEKYKTEYTFIPKKPNPFSSKENTDARIMLAAFSNNAVEVRKYLVWAFDRGIGANTKITSLAYLNVPNIIRKYKLYAIKKNSLVRYTNLPKNFLDWCKENANDIFNGYNLETMNDLGSLLNHVLYYGLIEKIENDVINKAIEFGLIKDNKLNIGK